MRIKRTICQILSLAKMVSITVDRNKTAEFDLLRPLEGLFKVKVFPQPSDLKGSRGFMPSMMWSQGLLIRSQSESRSTLFECKLSFPLMQVKVVCQQFKTTYSNILFSQTIDHLLDD